MAFFSVPARGDAGLQEDLNVFLRSHRVLTVHREFIGLGENSFWSLAVEYLEGARPAPPDMSRPGKERVDYKEVLSPSDFVLFAKLRDWRKQVAEKEKVPVYTILTNEQMAAIATRRPSTAAQLREVEGVGEAKAGKYGAAVLEAVAQADGVAAVPPATRPQEGAVPPAPPAPEGRR